MNNCSICKSWVYQDLHECGFGRLCSSCLDTDDPVFFQKLLKSKSNGYSSFKETLSNNQLATEDLILEVLEDIKNSSDKNINSRLPRYSYTINKRKFISPEFYKKWINYYGEKLIHLVAIREDIPLDFQKKIADGRIISSRRTLAHNKAAHPKILAKLAEDKMITVRSAVYYNDNTPVEVKEKLRPLIKLTKAVSVNSHIIKIIPSETVVKFLYPYEIYNLPFSKAPFIISEVKGQYCVPAGYLGKVVNLIVRYTSESEFELGYKIVLQSGGKFNNCTYYVPSGYLQQATKEEIHGAGLGGWVLLTALNKMGKSEPTKYMWAEVFKIPIFD